MFNSKKFATKSYEHQLQDHNKEFGLVADEEAVNFNTTLKTDRKKNDGMKPIEKALNKVRESSDSNPITEGMLNKGTDGSWLKTRDDGGEHPMDYHKETEKAYNSAYAKASKKNAKKIDPVSEENVDQDIDPDLKTTIVGNTQRSQLLSNFDSRDEFRKKNKSMKKASSETLIDADALLYHIFRTAASQKRELTEKEASVVKEINDTKIKVLAQEYQFPEEMNSNIHSQDHQVINMDDIDGQQVDDPIVGEYQPHNQPNPGIPQGVNPNGLSDDKVDLADQQGGNLDAEFAALGAHEENNKNHADGTPIMDIDLDVPHPNQHHNEQTPF